jgi:pectinesterase
LIFAVGYTGGARAQRTEVPLQTLAKLESFSQPYADYDGRKLRLDLYRPRERGKPLPAVVCIHGGGWRNGDRGSQTAVAQTLAANGYVAVTITYRLRDEAIFPAAIQDCKAAVRWLRANAKRLGVDSDRIGTTGLSAGGHLAALLATSGGVKELEGNGGNAEFSSTIQACIACGAQSDLESERIQELSRQPQDPFYRGFLGGTFDEVPEQYALASPRHHLDDKDPPLAFVTGAKDDRSTHAEAIRGDLMAKGIPTGLLVIPEAPHSFQGTQPFFDEFMQFTLDFFDHHLEQKDE